jgi:5'-nucleotidase
VTPRTLALAFFLASCVGACAGATEVPPPPVPKIVDAAGESETVTPPIKIQVLAINDFHGHLVPPVGRDGLVTVPAEDPFLREHPDAGAVPAPDGKTVLVPAGGVAYLAAHVKRLRRENPNTWVVSAGDLTGASPLVSNLFKDEPSVLAMNIVGLDFEGVGNHDFDRGLTELERLAHGGCSIGDCDGGGDFIGAHYEYLAANVSRVDAPDKTVFPAYAIRDTAGVRLAFIGVTLEATPTVSVPNAVLGLVFKNEAETINALFSELEQQRVDGTIVLIHQGGHQAGGSYDSCEHLTGDLEPFLAALRPEFDVVVSAHSHQAYDCVTDTRLGHRLVTSASSNGRIITRILLTWDPDTRKWLDKRAKNLIVTRDIPPDPEADKLVKAYEVRAAPITSRVVGYVKGNITRGNLGDEPRPGERRECESPAGELIADAQLAATRAPKDGGADIAFMNPGGVRADLLSNAGPPSYALSYAEAFEVQPFGNRLVTMTLTGLELQKLLDTQAVVHRLLQVSSGVSYRIVRDGESKMRIEPSSVRIYGKPLDSARKYRVTVNSFLAAGGDGFEILKEGTDRRDGPLDVDALTAYLGRESSPSKPLQRGAPNHRIGGDICK